jgi:hypothetical protein
MNRRNHNVLREYDGGFNIFNVLTCGLCSRGNKKNYIKLPENSDSTTSTTMNTFLNTITHYGKMFFLILLRLLLIVISHCIIAGNSFLLGSTYVNAYQYLILKISYFTVYLCTHCILEWITYEYSNQIGTEIIEINKTIEITELNNEIFTPKQRYMFKINSIKTKPYLKDHYINDDDDDDNNNSNEQSDYNTMNNNISLQLPTYSTTKRNISINVKPPLSNNIINQQSSLNITKKNIPIINVNTIGIRNHIRNIFRYFNYVWILGSTIAISLHTIAYMISYHRTFLSYVIHSSLEKEHIKSHYRFLITWQLETYIGFFFIMTNILIKLIIYYVYISRALESIKQLFQIKSIADMFMYNGSNGNINDTIQNQVNSNLTKYTNHSDMDANQNIYNQLYNTNVSVGINSQVQQSGYNAPKIQYNTEINYDTDNLYYNQQQHNTYEIKNTGKQFDLDNKSKILIDKSAKKLVNYLLVNSFMWVQTSCIFIVLKLHFILFYLLSTKLLFSCVNILSMLIMAMYFGHNVATTTINTPIQMIWSSENNQIEMNRFSKQSHIGHMMHEYSHTIHRDGMLKYHTSDGIQRSIPLQKKIQMDIQSNHLFQCRATQLDDIKLLCNINGHNDTINNDGNNNNDDDINCHLSGIFKVHAIRMINKYMNIILLQKQSAMKIPFSNNENIWNTWSGHNNIYTKQFLTSVQENILDIHVIDSNMLWHEKQLLYKWICEMHQSYFYEHSLDYFYINTIGAFLMIMIASVFHDICNSFSIESITSEQWKIMSTVHSPSEISSMYVKEQDIGVWNITSYYVALSLPNFFLIWYSLLDAIVYLGVLIIVYTALLFYRASKRSIKINST